VRVIDKSFPFKEFSILLNWHVWFVPIVLSIVLIVVSFFNYLLFHTLAEFFAIIVGVLMFVVAVYTHSLSRESFLMYLGIGYFWVAILDIIHTILYKGMFIVTSDVADHFIQFWVASRYIEALLLLSAPFFLTRKIHSVGVFIAYGVVAMLTMIIIMSGHFPVCYIEGVGLTDFKVTSEYIVCFMLLLSLGSLYWSRQHLKAGLFPFLSVAIVMTICAELAFTSYISVYEPANLIGHLFKLFSFWLILYSIIRLNMQEPFRHLVESESRFRKLVKELPIPITYVLGNGMIEDVNNRFEQTFGYTLEDVPTAGDWFQLAYPDEAYRQWVINTWNSDVQTSIELKQDIEPKEYKISCKNGDVRIVEISGVIIGDDLLVTFNDMTDRRDAEAALDLSEEKFRQAQKMEAIGTLVGGIAHDFNNALAGITGNLYLAQRDLVDSPKVLERLKNVEALSFRAAAIIQQLLTFARKSVVNMNPMIISSFLKETIKLHQITLPENIQLIVDIKNSDMHVKADINQLQQAIVNLINNAADALCDVTGPSMTIRLEYFLANRSFSTKHGVGENSEFACISISDNGEGIREQDLEHIFEPFFTTKPVGKGTGLGLAMVYGAVKSHEGIITVENNADKGACFRIYLPVLAGEKEHVILDDSDSQVLGAGECILLVDDEETIINVGKDVLASLNYQVLLASNGYEAIEMYKTHGDKIKLIIMDIVMPRMGGVDAAHAIHEINPAVKILFSSGYDRTQTLMNQQLPEHCLFISKPFSISALRRAISKLLAP